MKSIFDRRGSALTANVVLAPHEKKAVEEARSFARYIGLKGRLKLFRVTCGDQFTECGMQVWRKEQLLLENVMEFDDALGRPFKVRTQIDVGSDNGKPPSLFTGSFMYGPGLSSRKFCNKLVREITQPMYKKASEFADAN